jgi:hypothetical protein
VNREGGATRGPCVVDKNNQLTALLPASGVGSTVAESPTIFWYMPQMSSNELDAPSPAVEFVLEDANKKEVYYSAKYPLAKSAAGIVGTPGIMSLTVASLYPLALDQEYHWQLTLMCDANGSDHSQDTTVYGSLKRVKADPNLLLRAQQATPEERAVMYAKAQLWYETLATLVELRRYRPNDQNLADAWNNLFNSVALEKISQAPLFQGARNINN